MGLFDGIDERRAARIRKELGKAIRVEVAAELAADIERKVRRDVRRQARDELRAELKARAPTEAQRRDFVAFVEEVELDAYAQATMASRIADEADAALTARQRWARPVTTLATLLAPALVASIAQRTGPTTVVFAVALVTLILALGLLFGTTARHNRSQRDTAQRHRKISSDFLIIAERAKAYRMVHAEQLSDSDTLHELLEELRRAKERQDRHFHPSATALEAAREQVRYRIEPAPRRERIAPLDDDDASMSPAEDRLPAQADVET